MRFRTRAFLLSFVPFGLLLAGSFWMIQQMVQATVRDGLRKSMLESQLAMARVRSKTRLQNNRFLSIVGENAALKAGIQLMLLDKGSKEARLTVEDQLSDLCQEMGFDFLLASGPDGAPIAGASRIDGQLHPTDITRLPKSDDGFILLGDRVYQVASVPLDQGDENIGSISVGERYELREFLTPAVLLRDGKVLLSTVPGVGLPELEVALSHCSLRQECDLKLRGASYLSLLMPALSADDKYIVRSLENEDSTTAPVHAVLQSAFLTVLIVSVFVTLLFSVAASRSIVKPITAVISHLRIAESTGVLPEFTAALSSIREIRDLTKTFNRAAASIREGRESLQKAYVEFVGALANALDARDWYTAGHSRRVSDLACATAEALGLDPNEIDRIRIGALLHDIGKIGIPDEILQKPGPLSDAEYGVIKQHPGIGRRILEGVDGFAPFLEAVELHHENWNGTGYPSGRTGGQTPIDARIIHVSDAYDAMTTDRPYRGGRTHKEAIEALYASAGTMFDPQIVSAFAGLSFSTRTSCQPADDVANRRPVEVLG